MDRAEASHILGLDAGSTPDDARRAFRRLVLDHHPDRAGGDGDTARALIEAYRAFNEAEPERDTAELLQPLLDGETFELELPPDEAFLVLLDAAARLGDVTYVDAESGLLEVIRTFTDGTRASLVLTLQGRAATGTTEVFATEEPLG